MVGQCVSAYNEVASCFLIALPIPCLYICPPLTSPGYYAHPNIMSVYVIVDDNDSGLRYSPRAGSGNGTEFKNASAETHGWFIGAKGVYIMSMSVT